MVPLLEEHELSIRMEETDPVYAKADREMLIRIIQNLIRNCLAYADSNAVVRVEKTKRAVFSFGNQTTATADPDRLFDRFYREDRSTSRPGGMGLAIVKLLAEQMGELPGQEKRKAGCGSMSNFLLTDDTCSIHPGYNDSTVYKIESRVQQTRRKNIRTAVADAYRNPANDKAYHIKTVDSNADTV